MSSREEAQWNYTNELRELMEHFLHPKKREKKRNVAGADLGGLPLALLAGLFHKVESGGSGVSQSMSGG